MNRTKKRRMKKTLKVILIFLVIMIIVAVSWFLFLKKDKEIKMINLNNKTVEEIKDYANKYKLSLDIEYQYNDNIEKDKIINQNIAEGTVIHENDNLKVIISQGKLNKDIYKEYHVDELGKVPIMMYHGIHNLKNDDTGYTGGNVDKAGYQRTAEAFRNDLEMYYQKGYRMIRLDDYIHGIIDVPLGKSPIVITFDDGLSNNIKVTGIDENGNLIIDPNSAVGILEEFKQKYPDFQVTATFFVNGGIFNQPEYNEKILHWLIDHGYDIGNHTFDHPDFTKLSYDKSIEEVATVYQLLDKYIPNQYVKIVALPFGSPYSKNHDNFKAIVSGDYQGYHYESESTLQVGWESNFSPFSKNFDPLFLKRIRAYDNNGNDFDIAYNFQVLEKNRYISDGNKNTIVIKEEDKEYVKNTDLEIITYE